MNQQTTLYLIRHAQAEGNWKRIFQGHLDGAVSETGERQLTHLAKRFEPIPLDAVYASPLARAVQTAEAVAGGLPVATLPDLMEIMGGGFEGVRFDELPTRFPQEERLWSEQPHLFTGPEGGESTADVQARMRSALDGIAARHAGQTVAVVSHGCAIRCFCCYALGWPFERLAEVPWCDNTAVSLIVYEAGKPHVRFLGDNAHLPAEDSTFAKQDWWQRPVKKSTEQKGDNLQ